LQTHVSYWDVVREASVTRAAVHIGVKRQDVNRHRKHTIVFYRIENSMHVDTVEQSEKH